MIIESPLSVPVGRKEFILNLNHYRNAHYQTLNKAKIAYKQLIHSQIAKLPKMNKIIVHYTIYPKSRHLTDIGNVVSIHKKFFEDALVEAGKLPDDNYQHLLSSNERFGYVDKDNPRVTISITML